MKIHKIIIVATAVVLAGCSTIHEISAPKDEGQKKAREQVQKKQKEKLSKETSLWLGEKVKVSGDIKKGFIKTNYIVVTKYGKKWACFYTGFMGVSLSSIVCGGKAR